VSPPLWGFATALRDAAAKLGVVGGEVWDGGAAAVMPLSELLGFCGRWVTPKAVSPPLWGFATALQDAAAKLVVVGGAASASHPTLSPEANHERCSLHRRGEGASIAAVPLNSA
jgi:hypothetical protein